MEVKDEEEQTVHWLQQDYYRRDSGNACCRDLSVGFLHKRE
jgi:hypothetical protein